MPPKSNFAFNMLLQKAMQQENSTIHYTSEREPEFIEVGINILESLIRTRQSDFIIGISTTKKPAQHGLFTEITEQLELGYRVEK